MIRVEISGETVAEVVTQLRARLGELEPPIVRRGPSLRSSYSRGEAHPNSKRTDEQVRAMVARANEIGVWRAAAECGVNASWLSRVRSGHIWKHLTEPAA